MFQFIKTEPVLFVHFMIAWLWSSEIIPPFVLCHHQYVTYFWPIPVMPDFYVRNWATQNNSVHHHKRILNQISVGCSWNHITFFSSSVKHYSTKLNKYFTVIIIFLLVLQMFFSYLCTGWRERKEKTKKQIAFFLSAHLCNNQLILAHVWKEEDGGANYSEAMDITFIFVAQEGQERIDANYIQGQIGCIILLTKLQHLYAPA